jgi:serine/threonine protein kinase
MRQCAHCGHQSSDEGRFCARCGAPAEVHIDEDRSAYNTPVAPGTIFEGKYQVLEEIGRGGMGVVYRGHDLSLDRHVAIKVLPEQFNTDDDVIARFKKEAKAMASLDHPNIVPVYAIGQQGSFHYFVMKFLEGHTVAELLEKMRADGRNRFEPVQVQRILIQVCRGLAHAHQRGLIHRDIKPGNIMVSSDGHATIMDFGIVKEEKGGEALTRTGLVFGTPEYMAPEQAQGHAVPGPSTDLYSLGIVAYEMLSGVPPFRGDTPFSVVLKHIKEPPEPLFERIPGVNRGFEQAIFRSLEKRPDGRYRAAEDMQRALESIDVELMEMDEDDLLFGSDESVDRGLRAAPRPSTLPPPPPSDLLLEGTVRVTRTPTVNPPSPPPPSEITSLPPPSHIPARAAPAPTADRFEQPSARQSSPRARPLLPVAEVRPSLTPPPRTEPAVLEDRPGHYRSVMTARNGRNRERERRRLFWVGGLVMLVGLTGVLLIILALSRPGRSAQPEPVADASVQEAANPGASAPASAARSPEEGTEQVRLTILTEPVTAQVFEDGESRALGTTPYVLKGQKGDATKALTLRREGYGEKRLAVSLARDGIYKVRLEPVP